MVMKRRQNRWVRAEGLMIVGESYNISLVHWGRFAHHQLNGFPVKAPALS